MLETTMKPLLWYINCHTNSISSHTWLQHAKILTGSCISGSPFSAANLRQPRCQQRNKFPPQCTKKRNKENESSEFSTCNGICLCKTRCRMSHIENPSAGISPGIYSRNESSSQPPCPLSASIVILIHPLIIDP